MFKKLLSNLPFNPSLVGQVSFYAKRLRQEAVIRRLSFILIALAMLVQVIAVLAPPESSIMASPGNDFITGGIVSRDLNTVRQNLLNTMRTDTLVGTGYEFYGITEAVLQASTTHIDRIYMGDAKYRSAGRMSYGVGNEVEHRFLNGVVFYERDLAAVAINPNSYEDTLNVQRADGTWMAIMLSCGNPVLDTTQKATPPPEPPKPVSGSFDAIDCSLASGWAYDPRLTSTTIMVHIYVDDVLTAQIPADQARPDINTNGIPGNHGFKWTVPSLFRDSKPHTARIYAIEDVAARGISEGNKLLASNPEPRTFGPCTPPTTTTLIWVCRSDKGLIQINQSEKLASDLPPESCNEVTVCINNKLTTVKKYQQGTLPSTCPVIVVCRDNARISITSDQKLATDLPPEQCDSIQVCDGNKLTEILVRQYDPNKYRKPDPILGCATGSPKIVRNKIGSNTTQAITNANGTTANAGDTIKYTLTTTNTGNVAGKTIIDENLGDVLEYAEYISSDKGSFDSQTNYVTWGSVNIEPGQSVSHTITVKVKDTIPSTPRGATPSSSQSYDLNMNNVYGDIVNIKVKTPPIKAVEQTTQSLPNTGPGTSLLISFSIALIVGYFFARAKLMAKELEIVRTEYAEIERY